ncbi:hypothetical protein HWD31_gp08 [Pantoea phage vB_PagM_SSEM1]|uniref:Uncharacterized protein n=1 Tax=Pantoea phage vB_PagM_SSEM1 TaxID=2721760 RepID=A0A6H0DBN6_9CAUD|nr:hypothetical protein HWD31_gp08 [Pantoea phage vB_PagM_SSEM1]QIS79362.1 hypothetical protein SSEM1_gp08 [Pantoea phage vB_PagM_SSEM1]
MANNLLFRTWMNEFILLEFNEMRGQWEYYLMTYDLNGKPAFWTRAGNQEYQQYICGRKDITAHIGNNIRYPYRKSV